MAGTQTSTEKSHGHTPRPFHFNSSAHLLRIGLERADNLGELLLALHSCSEASIFQHIFRTLEEHHFIREGFSNDFAEWAYVTCREPQLAERLAAVDIREFTSVEAVRDSLISIVKQHIEEKPKAADHRSTKPFYFCASEVVVIPTPFVARSLSEFVEGLRRVSVHSIHHHFIEARLRLELASNDFSLWLEKENRLEETARSINRIDIYTSTMEDVRSQIIGIVEQAVN